MEYPQQDYNRHYIVQALFKLMSEYEYEKISVIDIADKAGVSRATFYRNFRRKEDILAYYFRHNTNEFNLKNRYFPRCKEDFVAIATNALTMFRQHKEPFKLIRKARLEYLYLDYLNSSFSEMFSNEYPDSHKYQPYLYAGMLFNVSMAWLDDDCADPVDALSELIVNAIYFG